MQPPENTEVIETELATLWSDENGIVCAKSKKNIALTIEKLTNVIEVIEKLANGKKICFLDEITFVAPPDKAARIYVASAANKLFIALALITKSPLSTMIANILFRLNLLSVPTKMFTDETEAREWLKQYL